MTEKALEAGQPLLPPPPPSYVENAAVLHARIAALEAAEDRRRARARIAKSVFLGFLLYLLLAPALDQLLGRDLSPWDDDGAASSPGFPGQDLPGGDTAVGNDFSLGFPFPGHGNSKCVPAPMNEPAGPPTEGEETVRARALLVTLRSR